MGRARLGLEPEDELHHPLHLALLGPPVAAHRLLDAQGRTRCSRPRRTRPRRARRRAPARRRARCGRRHPRRTPRARRRPARAPQCERLYPLEDRQQPGVRALRADVRQQPKSPTRRRPPLRGRSRTRTQPSLGRCRGLSRAEGRRGLGRSPPEGTAGRTANVTRVVRCAYPGSPSPAMVLASGALVVALGGTSVAAVATVPRASCRPRAEERRGDEREDPERERPRRTSRTGVCRRLTSGTARCAGSTSGPGRSRQARPAPRAARGSGVSGREQVAAETPLTSVSPKNLTATCPAGKKASEAGSRSAAPGGAG